ncbi:MAG: SRPBCC family protein [Gammaproteobacteria bacterium]
MPRTYQSIVINVPVDRAWQAVRNFHELSWAPDVIQECKAVGDKQGDQIGARRRLNGAFLETLVELNDKDHRLGYRIEDGPSPVSKGEVQNYYGLVQLRPVTDSNSTFIEWSSSWEAKSDEAVAFCRKIYVSLLRALKQTLET